MSVRQIEVTECKDCPFVWLDNSYHDDHKCNIESKEIPDTDKTPDWCPLMQDDIIEVSHIDK